MIALAAGAAAVLVAAVVFGVLLLVHKEPTPKPAAAAVVPSVTVVVTTTAPAPSASRTFASVTPSTSVTLPTVSPGGIDLAAVATNPVTPQVAQTLDTYFVGINNHDGAAAAAAFDPAGAINPQNPSQVTRFDSEIATSYDDQIVVHSIAANPSSPGGYLVAVTFRSQQAPAAGPGGNEACTNWSLTYSMTSAPKLLKATGVSHKAC